MRLPIAASPVRTVALRLSSSTAVDAERDVHLAAEFALEARHRRRDLWVGRHRRGVDDAELRPPGDLRGVPFCRLTSIVTSISVT